jgi:phosphoadenosine phosphosulfate reductase
MSNVTVIDAKRGLRPQPADDAGITAHLSELLAKAQGRDAHGILELALTGEFKGKTAVVSSFGAESAVLLKLVADIDPNTPILFLNTGKLFGETLRYRDRLQDVLGLGDVRSLSPSLEERATKDPEGTLWSKNADACCDFRKTIPLSRALEPFAAQITGRKRFQNAPTCSRWNISTAATASIRCGSGTCTSSKPLPNATICRAIRWWKTAIPRSAACLAPAASRRARTIAPDAGRAPTRMSAASI